MQYWEGTIFWKDPGVSITRLTAERRAHYENELLTLTNVRLSDFKPGTTALGPSIDFEEMEIPMSAVRFIGWRRVERR
jgi:hypothetical protein